MTRLVSAPGNFTRSRRAWRRFLHTIIEQAQPDIIVGTEAKRRHLRSIVPQTRWVVRQRWNGTLDREARRGGFAIWRRSLTESNREPRQTQRLGSRMSLWPLPVLNRYIGHADLEVGLRVRRVFWVHFPLERTGRQPEYLASLKREIARAEADGLEWLIGGDYNQSLFDVARKLGGNPRGVPGGITGWITGPGVHVSDAATMPAIRGFDHRPFWIDVEN